MQALRQMGGGVIIAIVSIFLVIGGISLALAETAHPQAEEAPTFIPPTVQVNPPIVFTPQIIIRTETPISTATSTPFPTLPPVSPTPCLPPGGWIQIIVGPNDTIYSLAQRYKIPEDALINGNCLTSVNLPPGNAIHVPYVPTVVVPPCTPPAGWVQAHVVQPGENLFRIALSYGLSYPQLQQGNCMGSSTTIYSGQRLWVPNIPTLTPIPGVTITLVFPSSTPSSTPMPATATQMPGATSTFISTASPSSTASLTPAPASTQTPSLTSFP